MKIAVLGWGSLIWKPGDLRTAGDFLNDGPTLPIEFCRISNDGRLTLVIDEKYGTSCTTYYAESTFGDLKSAIENLRLREGMPTATRVGFVNLPTEDSHQEVNARQPRSVAAISKWALDRGYDAAIWTALGIKFKEVTGNTFSVDAAMRYLDGLDVAKQANALNYIRRSPPEVQTPTRTAAELRWPLGD